MQQRKHAIASSVFRPRPSRAPRRRSALLRNARMCQLRTLPRPSLVSLRRELLPLRPLRARPASASDAFNSSAGFRSRPSSRSSPTYTNPSTRAPSSAVRAPSCSGLTSCTFYTVIQSFKLHVRVLFPRGCSMPSSAQLQFVLLIPTREHHF
jgi:hypothetical protein